MKNNENPWLDMPNSTQKRISAETAHDIFWVTDRAGKYGFYIKTAEAYSGSDALPILNGISPVKRTAPDGKGELFLFLNDANDWELFKVLCGDLYASASGCGADEEMMDAVEIRLRRWHLLLKRENFKPLTAEIQMGLFAEMLCLKDLIAPRIGIKQAASAWVGPIFDKQDFLLENSAIEVKSYRTSKGAVAEISSPQQLVSEKDALFLAAYGLTNTETGESIEDVSKTVIEMLAAESAEAVSLFENKLLNCGYAPELLKEPLLKFKADKVKAYSITNEFPKIKPEDLASQIVSVKYAVDLTLCKDFEVDLNSIII